MWGRSRIRNNRTAGTPCGFQPPLQFLRSGAVRCRSNPHPIEFAFATRDGRHRHLEALYPHVHRQPLGVSRLAKTPSCTAQAPDSELAGGVLAPAAECPLEAFSDAVAVCAGFEASVRPVATEVGEVGFCAVAPFSAVAGSRCAATGFCGVSLDDGAAEDFAARVPAASPGRADCVLLPPCPLLTAWPRVTDCAPESDCELPARELAGGVPADWPAPACEDIADDPLAPPVSACGEPGCSGAPGCGIAGPVVPPALPAESDCECESSPKLIVYDLNGGSSDEGEAAPAGAVAAGPFGPDSSSGTNNTIKTTRMIAPVSRSFTRSSTMGTK